MWNCGIKEIYGESTIYDTFIKLYWTHWTVLFPYFCFNVNTGSMPWVTLEIPCSSNIRRVPNRPPSKAWTSRLDWKRINVKYKLIISILSSTKGFRASSPPLNEVVQSVLRIQPLGFHLRRQISLIVFCIVSINNSVIHYSCETLLWRHSGQL